MDLSSQEFGRRLSGLMIVANWHWQSPIGNSVIRISICQLVLGQRSQHFRLDLLIFPRVQMRAIVGTNETLLKCN